MNIPKELSDYEKNKKLCNSLKFGDVIINHWASDENPYKTGVFVKRCTFDGKAAIEITDMKDGFWHFYIDRDMKIEFTGKNILSQSEIDEKDKEIERLQNIGIVFCNEIERLKGIIYTAFTHMPNDPFQTEQEAWEKFKAENNL